MLTDSMSSCLEFAVTTVNLAEGDVEVEILGITCHEKYQGLNKSVYSYFNVPW